MPRPAMKRIALKLIGSFIRPAAAVNRLKMAMHRHITMRLPKRSERFPKIMLPNIIPNSAELAMKPACVASTPMSFMIDGSAMPTTARS